METKFLKGALFSGMTSNAFKLGTVLSLGWFWMRPSGCHTVYRGQDGNIDYDNIQAVMSLGDSQVSIPGQGLPVSTIWHYIRRQISGCGLESGDSRACVLIINSEGEMIGNAPNPPLNLIAERLSGGRIRLRWRYTRIAEEISPTGFNIYMDSGSGFDFSSPDATIAYGIGGINNEFSWTSGALTHGQIYRFCVRSHRTEPSDWVSPTLYNDPDDMWHNEANAYDDDTGTYADRDYAGGGTNYLELLINPILCDKVRCWIGSGNSWTMNLYIDVFYDGGWNNIQTGKAPAQGEFIEISIPAGSKTVTKARVGLTSTGPPETTRLYEFDFHGKRTIESQNTDYAAADADSEGPAAITGLQASYEES